MMKGMGKGLVICPSLQKLPIIFELSWHDLLAEEGQ
jgi:hypothetical protein